MNPQLSAIVARNIRAERGRRSWTQEQVAARVGLAASTIGNYETGTRKIGLDDLPAFCRAFDVPLSQLLFGADPDDLAALRI